MPLNRLVAFILGPIITLLAGYISLWLSRNFPGASLPDQASIEGMLTSGLLTVIPMILAHRKIQKWLDGWKDWEARQDKAALGAVDESFSRFMEQVAEKTGVPLPSAESGPQSPAVPTDADPPPALRPDAFQDQPQA